MWSNKTNKQRRRCGEEGAMQYLNKETMELMLQTDTTPMREMHRVPGLIVERGNALFFFLGDDAHFFRFRELRPVGVPFRGVVWVPQTMG
jgi:hypothetical protein